MALSDTLGDGDSSAGKANFNHSEFLSALRLASQKLNLFLAKPKCISTLLTMLDISVD